MLYQSHLPARVAVNRPAGESPEGARLAVAGAHGGAGATTLAALLAPAADLGVIRRDGLSLAPGAAPVPAPLLLACRPDTWSAELATAAVTALERAGYEVAVLVITGDGWPQTAVAAARYRLLSARVGAVVPVPFVPALRGCPDPVNARLPRGARRALAQIRLTAAVPEQARPAHGEVHHERR